MNHFANHLLKRNTMVLAAIYWGPERIPQFPGIQSLGKSQSQRYENLIGEMSPRHFKLECDPSFFENILIYEHGFVIDSVHFHPRGNCLFTKYLYFQMQMMLFWFSFDLVRTKNETKRKDEQ